MNKTELWNRVANDAKFFGCHDRLTPHICALSHNTRKELSRLKANAVLDVGAGDKRYKDSIYCIKYIALDVSGNLDVIADAAFLPFKDDSFDMIICTQVLEHVKNPFLILEEFNRVLRAKGIIFLTVPTVMYLHEIPDDYFRYTKYGIEYLLKKNNFSIQVSETACSGFIVTSELFFIGIYSIIYKLFKSNFVRCLLVSSISYMSFAAVKLDNSYFKNIFPGNILVIGASLKNNGAR